MDKQKNEKIVWDYLRSKGLSETATAGIMGNIDMESGFNTSSTNGSSGAFGLVQWLGGRKSNLYAFAKKQGKPATDIIVQLDFLWNELNTSEKKTLDALKGGNGTATTYAKRFDELFERSEGTTVGKRQGRANHYLSVYGGRPRRAGESVAEGPSSGDNDGFITGLAQKIVIGVLVILFCILGILFLMGTFGGDKA